MTKTNSTQAMQPTPKPSDVPTPTQALKRLEPLVGELTTERKHPYSPPNGRARFEWLRKGNSNSGFLVLHAEVGHPDFPNSVTLIGADASAQASVNGASESFVFHYFDTRGVERVYHMSLRDGVWKLWRDFPGFSQRFTGTLSSDGQTIRGAWESSTDGVHWIHDFDVIYTRVK